MSMYFKILSVTLILAAILVFSDSHQVIAQSCNPAVQVC